MWTRTIATLTSRIWALSIIDDALAMQTAMLAARIDGSIGDTLLMMEHPHVFTLGRGADERFIVAQYGAACRFGGCRAADR